MMTLIPYFTLDHEIKYLHAVFYGAWKRKNSTAKYDWEMLHTGFTSGDSQWASAHTKF